MRILDVLPEICFANLVLLFLYSATAPQPTLFQFTKAEKILVFAAHQDDDVIEAGGVAIANQRLGGKTKLVFLTEDKNAEIAKVRREETKRAWSVLGTHAVAVEFLPFKSKAQWQGDEIVRATKAVADAIRKYKPTVIIAPLEEGGQYEHDLLSQIVRQVSLQFPLVRVWYAAEYNPYYVPELQPEKLLWFFVRLLPFVPYKEPNYGLNPRFQRVLNMTSSDLETKKKMLLAYDSQREIIPLRQFGYPDLFDGTRAQTERVYLLGSKRMSLWGIISIALLALGAIGFGSRIGTSFALTMFLAVFTTLPMAFISVVKPQMFREECLLLAFVVAGVWLNAVQLFFRRSSSRIR